MKLVTRGNYGCWKNFSIQKKGVDCFKNARFIEEPSRKVKKYKLHKPLEFYQNPHQLWIYSTLYMRSLQENVQ